LLSHPESIATPRSNASEQRMAPSRKVCWRNFSHFQRNSARFSVVSTMVKRKFILVHLYLLDVLLALPPLKASPSSKPLTLPLPSTTRTVVARCRQGWPVSMRRASSRFPSRDPLATLSSPPAHQYKLTAILSVKD